MKISSEEVIRLLKLSKLSSYKIAQKTGISDQTIQNYRDGKTIPTGAYLTILAKYLEIPIQNDETDTSEIENKCEEPKQNYKNKAKCPECEKWKDKYLVACENLNIVQGKYNEMLEKNIQLKKEIEAARSAQEGEVAI